MNPVAAFLLQIAAVGFAGFLCGSIPFGAIFAKLRGIDLHKVGSGNIGATNAARALGKPIGVLTLVLDAGKSAGPLVAARAHAWAAPEHLPLYLALFGFGAVTGHMFTPWLGGRGGKGVATGFGTFLALAPLPAAIAAAIWVALYAITRVSSIGSLAAVLALPLLLALFHAPFAYLVLALALAPLIVLKHRANIRRLLRREENRI